jgi:hypothetical protein
VHTGELDNLISHVPHSRLITCQVFGAPAAADKAQLVLIMSGDYRSKKEVAYLLVPAVGRKVYDLGGNLEKCELLMRSACKLCRTTDVCWPRSAHIQAYRELYDFGVYGSACRGSNIGREIRDWCRGRSESRQRYIYVLSYVFVPPFIYIADA